MTVPWYKLLAKDTTIGPALDRKYGLNRLTID